MPQPSSTPLVPATSTVEEPSPPLTKSSNSMVLVPSPSRTSTSTHLASSTDHAETAQATERPDTSSWTTSTPRTEESSLESTPTMVIPPRSATLAYQTTRSVIGIRVPPLASHPRLDLAQTALTALLQTSRHPAKRCNRLSWEGNWGHVTIRTEMVVRAGMMVMGIIFMYCICYWDLGFVLYLVDLDARRPVTIEKHKNRSIKIFVPNALTFVFLLILHHSQ